MNPTPGKYFLLILHGHFSGIHFLISPLKKDKDDFCFISAGTILLILDVSMKWFPSHSTRYLQMVDETENHFLSNN